MAMIQSFPTGSGNGTSKISQKLGNAATNITGSTNPAEDGLYVEDLSNKINALNIAQKTVNSELDYAACWYYNANGLTANVNDILTYDGKNTNIDIDITTGKINLKGGKKYFIGMNLRTRQGSCFYGLYNSSNNLLCYGFKNASNFTTSKWSNKELNYVVTPNVDTQYFIKIDESYDSCLISSYELYIAEIGREVTIDPVAYVDSTKGIEDTPVGELITKIGSTTPAHYLPCNGKVYNITDYPELAQCIKDEFGSFNYYGGDGVTTFAVPNYNSYNWWTPGLVNGVVPSPYAVYVSSVFNTTQYQKELLFDGIISKDSCWHSAADGSDTNIWVKFDFGSNTYINGLRMAVRSTTYVGQLPSTFTIEGSYDDVTYDVIKSYSSLPNPTSTAFREHLFDKPVNYRYYKLNHMTSNAKNNGHDYCSIAELEFAKVESTSHIKYEPTYFMVLQPTGYDTLDVDCGAINVSLGSSNTAIRTLWTYTNNNTNGQPIKINLHDLVATTNTGSDEGYITVDIDGVESQRVQCPTSTGTPITIPKFDLQPGETFSIKTDWVNVHTSVTWKLTGRFTTLTNSI